MISAFGLATVLVWSAACGQAAPPPPASSAPVTVHEHRAPHGGILVELGAEAAHVELVPDPNTGSLTAYILDGEAEESVRLRQSSLMIAIEKSGSSAAEVLELPARANILTGETVGDSSEFSATSPSLLGIKNIKGRVVDLVVKGQDFKDVPF